MNRILPLASIALLLTFSIAGAATDEVAATGAAPQYLRVSVDRVVLDTRGLAQASTSLAESIDELSLAIARLSSGDANLSDEDKAIIASAVQSVDAAVLRLSIYTFALFAALALAAIAVIWFIYIQYLGPLASKLDEISGAPEQFAAIAGHMQETSNNLLQLERLAAERRPPKDDD